MLLITNEAAATLTVNTDAFRNERKNVSSRPRRITGVAIVGGNAINEAEINLYIGDVYLGAYRNSLNGAVAPIYPDHFQPIGNRFVPPGEKISALVGIAPTVSPLIIHLHGDEY